MPKGDWLDSLSKWSNVLHLDPSSCLTVITEVHSCASHLLLARLLWSKDTKSRSPLSQLPVANMAISTFTGLTV